MRIDRYEISAQGPQTSYIMLAQFFGSKVPSCLKRLWGLAQADVAFHNTEVLGKECSLLFWAIWSANFSQL